MTPVSLMEPLPLDALMSGLEDVHQQKNKCSLSPQVLKGLKSHAAVVKDRESQKSQDTQWAEKLLEFAKSRKGDKTLRVASSDVPDPVVPAGYKAVLHDIKLARRGPDDSVYQKEEMIRKMIPRGTSVLEWKNTKTNDTWCSVVIYAHKKFTGGIGDEDEYQPQNNEVWRSYFIKDPDMAKRVVCMEKVNGEAAHIAGRYIDGNFYLIAGSKNVHMVIREKSNIDLYKESRYEYAKIIAKTVWDTLASLDQQRQHLVRSLLHHTKCTFVGEILQPQNQHIVNLSYLSKPEISFISMTPTFTGPDVNTLLVIPPDYFLDLCSTLGLHTAAYTVVKDADVMVRKEETRKKRNTEGEVFYFLDEDENTIGLTKVKTTWYTVLRALREKACYTFTTAKKKDGWTLETGICKTHKRFSEIQEWLKFSDDYLDKWKKLSEKFLRWLHMEIKEGITTPVAIRPSFPVLWSEFLETTNQTDHIELEMK